MKSNCREGISSDSVDSKSFVENLVRNNNECTGFFMCFSVCLFVFLYDMYLILNTQIKFKYLYSLLAMKVKYTSN